MFKEIKQRNHNPIYKRLISFFILTTFLTSSVIPPQVVQAQTLPILNLPTAGTMIAPTPGFTPALIKGVTIHPDNPLYLDFIVDTGDQTLQDEELRVEADKLVKYFLASLTVPEEDLWVNLSPYEKNRIIPEGFGRTDMGRDLLAQDYILKQLTASLMYPEDNLGRKFWDRVNEKVRERVGVQHVESVHLQETFNKIWIVPESAKIYEHTTTAEGEFSAFVINSKLKVMLEEDLVAREHAMDETADTDRYKSKTADHTISQETIREILLPEIEKEVNEGENFANLRQIYNSMILAAWYKQNLKQSLLGQVYVDQNKTKGINQDDIKANQAIYNQYLEAFKTGVYDYIREDYDPVTQEIVPRKYVSGGFSASNDNAQIMDHVKTFRDEEVFDLNPADFAELAQAMDRSTIQVGVGLYENTDATGFANARQDLPLDKFEEGNVVIDRAAMNIEQVRADVIDVLSPHVKELKDNVEHLLRINKADESNKARTWFLEYAAKLSDLLGEIRTSMESGKVSIKDLRILLNKTESVEFNSLYYFERLIRAAQINDIAFFKQAGIDLAEKEDARIIYPEGLKTFLSELIYEGEKANERLSSFESILNKVTLGNLTVDSQEIIGNKITFRKNGKRDLVFELVQLPNQMAFKLGNQTYFVGSNDSEIDISRINPIGNIDLISFFELDLESFDLTRFNWALPNDSPDRMNQSNIYPANSHLHPSLKSQSISETILSEARNVVGAIKYRPEDEGAHINKILNSIAILGAGNEWKDYYVAQDALTALIESNRFPELNEFMTGLADHLFLSYVGVDWEKWQKYGENLRKKARSEGQESSGRTLTLFEKPVESTRLDVPDPENWVVDGVKALGEDDLEFIPTDPNDAVFKLGDEAIKAAQVVAVPMSGGSATTVKKKIGAHKMVHLALKALVENNGEEYEQWISIIQARIGFLLGQNINSRIVIGTSIAGTPEGESDHSIRRLLDEDYADQVASGQITTAIQRQGLVLDEKNGYPLRSQDGHVATTAEDHLWAFMSILSNKKLVLDILRTSNGIISIGNGDNALNYTRAGMVGRILEARGTNNPISTVAVASLSAGDKKGGFGVETTYRHKLTGETRTNVEIREYSEFPTRNKKISGFDGVDLADEEGSDFYRKMEEKSLFIEDLTKERSVAHNVAFYANDLRLTAARLFGFDENSENLAEQLSAVSEDFWANKIMEIGSEVPLQEVIGKKVPNETGNSDQEVKGFVTAQKIQDFIVNAPALLARDGKTPRTVIQLVNRKDIFLPYKGTDQQPLGRDGEVLEDEAPVYDLLANQRRYAGLVEELAAQGHRVILGTDGVVKAFIPVESLEEIIEANRQIDAAEVGQSLLPAISFNTVNDELRKLLQNIDSEITRITNLKNSRTDLSHAYRYFDLVTDQLTQIARVVKASNFVVDKKAREGSMLELSLILGWINNFTASKDSLVSAYSNLDSYLMVGESDVISEMDRLITSIRDAVSEVSAQDSEIDEDTRLDNPSESGVSVDSADLVDAQRFLTHQEKMTELIKNLEELEASVSENIASLGRNVEYYNGAKLAAGYLRSAIAHLKMFQSNLAYLSKRGVLLDLGKADELMRTKINLRLSRALGDINRFNTLGFGVSVNSDLQNQIDGFMALKEMVAAETKESAHFLSNEFNLIQQSDFPTMSTLVNDSLTQQVTKESQRLDRVKDLLQFSVAGKICIILKNSIGQFQAMVIALRKSLESKFAGRTNNSFGVYEANIRSAEDLYVSMLSGYDIAAELIDGFDRQSAQALLDHSREIIDALNSGLESARQRGESTDSAMIIEGAQGKIEINIDPADWEEKVIGGENFQLRVIQDEFLRNIEAWVKNAAKRVFYEKIRNKDVIKIIQPRRMNERFEPQWLIEINLREGTVTLFNQNNYYKTDKEQVVRGTIEIEETVDAAVLEDTELKSELGKNEFNRLSHQINGALTEASVQTANELTSLGLRGAYQTVLNIINASVSEREKTDQLIDLFLDLYRHTQMKEIADILTDLLRRDEFTKQFTSAEISRMKNAIKDTADALATRIYNKVLRRDGIIMQVRFSEGGGRDEVAESFFADDLILPPDVESRRQEVKDAVANNKKYFIGDNGRIYPIIYSGLDVIEGTNMFVLNSQNKTLDDVSFYEAGSLSVIVTGNWQLKGNAINDLGNSPDSYVGAFFTNLGKEAGAFADETVNIDGQEFSLDDHEAYARDPKKALLAYLTYLAKVRGQDIKDVQEEIILLRRERERQMVLAIREIKEEYGIIGLHIVEQAADDLPVDQVGITDGTMAHILRATMPADLYQNLTGRSYGLHKTYISTAAAPESMMNLAIAAEMADLGAVGRIRPYSKNMNELEDGSKAFDMSRRGVFSDEEKAEMFRLRPHDAQQILDSQLSFSHRDVAGHVNARFTFISTNGVFHQPGVSIDEDNIRTMVLTIDRTNPDLVQIAEEKVSQRELVRNMAELPQISLLNSDEENEERLAERIEEIITENPDVEMEVDTIIEEDNGRKVRKTLVLNSSTTKVEIGVFFDNFQVVVDEFGNGNVHLIVRTNDPKSTKVSAREKQAYQDLMEVFYEQGVDSAQLTNSYPVNLEPSGIEELVISMVSLVENNLGLTFQALITFDDVDIEIPINSTSYEFLVATLLRAVEANQSSIKFKSNQSVSSQYETSTRILLGLIGLIDRPVLADKATIESERIITAYDNSYQVSLSFNEDKQHTVIRVQFGDGIAVEKNVKKSSGNVVDEIAEKIRSVRKDRTPALGTVLKILNPYVERGRIENKKIDDLAMQVLKIIAEQTDVESPMDLNVNMFLSYIPGFNEKKEGVLRVLFEEFEINYQDAMIDFDTRVSRIGGLIKFVRSMSSPGVRSLYTSEDRATLGLENSVYAIKNKLQAEALGRLLGMFALSSLGRSRVTIDRIRNEFNQQGVGKLYVKTPDGDNLLFSRESDGTYEINYAEFGIWNKMSNLYLLLPGSNGREFMVKIYMPNVNNSQSWKFQRIVNKDKLAAELGMRWLEDAGDRAQMILFSGSVKKQEISNFENQLSQLAGQFPDINLWVKFRYNGTEQDRLADHGLSSLDQAEPDSIGAYAQAKVDSHADYRRVTEALQAMTTLFTEFGLLQRESKEYEEPPSGFFGPDIDRAEIVKFYGSLPDNGQAKEMLTQLQEVMAQERYQHLNVYIRGKSKLDQKQKLNFLKTMSLANLNVLQPDTISIEAATNFGQNSDPELEAQLRQEIEFVFNRFGFIRNITGKLANKETRETYRDLIITELNRLKHQKVVATMTEEDVYRYLAHIIQLIKEAGVSWAQFQSQRSEILDQFGGFESPGTQLFNEDGKKVDRLIRPKTAEIAGRRTRKVSESEYTRLLNKKIIEEISDLLVLFDQLEGKPIINTNGNIARFTRVAANAYDALDAYNRNVITVDSAQSDRAEITVNNWVSLAQNAALWVSETLPQLAGQSVFIERTISQDESAIRTGRGIHFEVTEGNEHYTIEVIHDDGPHYRVSVQQVPGKGKSKYSILIGITEAGSSYESVKEYMLPVAIDSQEELKKLFDFLSSALKHEQRKLNNDPLGGKLNLEGNSRSINQMFVFNGSPVVNQFRSSDNEEYHYIAPEIGIPDFSLSKNRDGFYVRSGNAIIFVSQSGYAAVAAEQSDQNTDRAEIEVRNWVQLTEKVEDFIKTSATDLIDEIGYIMTAIKLDQAMVKSGKPTRLDFNLVGKPFILELSARENSVYRVEIKNSDNQKLIATADLIMFGPDALYIRIDESDKIYSEIMPALKAVSSREGMEVDKNSPLKLLTWYKNQVSTVGGANIGENPDALAVKRILDRAFSFVNSKRPIKIKLLSFALLSINEVIRIVEDRQETAENIDAASMTQIKLMADNKDFQVGVTFDQSSNKTIFDIHYSDGKSIQRKVVGNKVSGFYEEFYLHAVDGSEHNNLLRALTTILGKTDVPDYVPDSTMTKILAAFSKQFPELLKSPYDSFAIGSSKFDDVFARKSEFWDELAREFGFPFYVESAFLNTRENGLFDRYRIFTILENRYGLMAVATAIQKSISLENILRGSGEKNISRKILGENSYEERSSQRNLELIYLSLQNAMKHPLRNEENDSLGGLLIEGPGENQYGTHKINNVISIGGVPIVQLIELQGQTTKTYYPMESLRFIKWDSSNEGFFVLLPDRRIIYIKKNGFMVDMTSTPEIFSDRDSAQIEKKEDGIGLLEGVEGNDAAEITPVGGINLNTNLLDLQIERDADGLPLPLQLQPIHKMKIDGFLPVIINITPINNLPMLLGIAIPSEDAPTEVSYNLSKAIRQEAISEN